MGVDDTYWMQRAYALAMRAYEQGEVPVGAVIVGDDRQVLGEGFNQVIQNSDPTAHAEIVAIRAAAAFTNNYRLKNATLYVTLEPCCMCAGALVHARLNRLVFATRDLRAGAAGSAYNLMRSEALNHSVQMDEGILQNECSDLLIKFFAERR
jgi:tRNA(adenine34) deaminase